MYRYHAAHRTLCGRYGKAGSSAWLAAAELAACGSRRGLGSLRRHLCTAKHTWIRHNSFAFIVFEMWCVCQTCADIASEVLAVSAACRVTCMQHRTKISAAVLTCSNCSSTSQCTALRCTGSGRKCQSDFPHGVFFHTAQARWAACTDLGRVCVE